MRQIRPFADERLGGGCVYCGGAPDTRDHIPPRVFLDDPLPANLAVVPCCRRCNEVTSADEEYVACLFEVAACGTTEASGVERPAIARILAARPRLQARLRAAHDPSVGTVAVEHDRVQRVVEKVARGLWTFETATPSGASVASVYAPLSACDSLMLEDFEALSTLDLLPEVGSRLMVRIIKEWSMQNRWQVVQPERFAYAVEAGAGEQRVKMLLRGYLAAVVSLPS